MVSCSAYGCFNDSRKKIPGLSFHRYPKNVAQRTLWISRTNRIKFNPSATAALCSAHFEDNCFETMYKNKYLKPGSIPTIFPEHAREVKKLIRAAKKKEKQLKTDEANKKQSNVTKLSISNNEDAAELATSPVPSTTSPSPTDSPLKKNITSLKKSILQRVESKPLTNIKTIMSKESTHTVTDDITSGNTSNNLTLATCGSHEHMNTLRISILKQNTLPVMNTDESFLCSTVSMPHILIDATSCSSNSTNLTTGGSSVKDNSLRISIANSARNKSTNDNECTTTCEISSRHIIIDASPSPMQSASTTSPTPSVSLHNKDTNVEKSPHLLLDKKSTRDASTSPILWLVAQKPLTLKSEILSMRKYTDKYRQQISTLQQAKRRIQKRNEVLENSIKKLKAS